jgi:hypothetical protein
MVDKCSQCQGTGCNRSLPPMTKYMWRACSKCDGSGFLPILSGWVPGKTSAIYQRQKDGSIIWAGKIKVYV